MENLPRILLVWKVVKFIISLIYACLIDVRGFLKEIVVWVYKVCLNYNIIHYFSNIRYMKHEKHHLQCVNNL